MRALKPTNSGTCRLIEIIDTSIPQKDRPRHCDTEALESIDSYFSGHCQKKKGESEVVAQCVFEATKVILEKLQRDARVSPKKNNKAADKA